MEMETKAHGSRRPGYMKSATDKQNRKDAAMTRDRLANFDWNTCQARMVLERLFERMNGASMLSLAQVVSEKLGISLDREATRRKSVLYKWFDENLTVIEDFLSNSVVVEKVSGGILGSDRAKARFTKLRNKPRLAPSVTESGAV